MKYCILIDFLCAQACEEIIRMPIIRQEIRMIRGKKTNCCEIQLYCVALCLLFNLLSGNEEGCWYSRPQQAETNRGISYLK